MPLPSCQATGNRCFFAFLSLLLLVLGGCVEQSIVFKVLHDGTALIHVRTFTMPPPFGAAKAADDLPKGVNETLVAELLKELGPGVTVKSNENSSNSRGWAGTELILLCDDVNSLKLTPEAIELLMATGNRDYTKKGEIKDESSDAKNGLNKLDIEFELNEDQLVVNLNWQYAKQEPITKDRAQDPFANRPAASNPWATSFLASVLREIRTGVYVETERKITKSNASYAVRNDTLITIMELDGSKIDTDKFNKLSGKPPTSQADAKAMLKDFEGLSVETQPKVIVDLE